MWTKILGRVGGIEKFTHAFSVASLPPPKEKQNIAEQIIIKSIF